MQALYEALTEKGAAMTVCKTPLSKDRIEAIILSMTKEERANPNLLNASRKQRIAKGAGVEIAEVNRIVKQFEQSKKKMKQLSGMPGGKRKGMGGLGGLMGKFKMPF